MSESPRSGILGLVLVAAAVTALVTAVRLYGELQGWDPKFFSPEPGGGMALVGIAWLPIVFGFMFGRRLARNGHRPKSMLAAALVPAAGFGVIAGILALYKDDKPTMLMLLTYVPAGVVLVLLFVWARAAWTNLLYGILARVPVVLVQYMGLLNAWGTHYEKLPPGETMTPAQIGNALAMFQLTAWVPFTVIVGGLFAAIGAATVRKSA